MNKGIIIGVSGKFASGKDTCVADHLVAKWLFRRASFAEKLKNLCTELFGMSGKDRALLQSVGQAMRGIRDDVWVKHALGLLYEEQNYVFADVRHINEFQALRERGAVLIRLECDEGERIARYQKLYGCLPDKREINHSSETALDSYVTLFDYVINTGRLSPEEVHLVVDGIYAAELSKRKQEEGKK